VSKLKQGIVILQRTNNPEDVKDCCAAFMTTKMEKYIKLGRSHDLTMEEWQNSMGFETDLLLSPLGKNIIAHVEIRNTACAKSYIKDLQDQGHRIFLGIEVA
jgi:sorbitol-specific phosphotransferase system component IIA